MPSFRAGQPDDEFYRRAGNIPAGEGKLLVDHGENAAAAGIDDDNSSVELAKGFDHGLSDDRVFAR